MRESDMTVDAMPSHFRVRVWRLLARICFLALCAGSARAQQFSAGIVTRHDDAGGDVAPVRVGKLSARDGHVRIEATDFADGFFLIDTAAVTQTAYFIRPAARIYMEARQSSRLTQLFVPVDPEAPCPQWQAMARLAGRATEGEWHCERVSEETIDGRSAVVFRVSTADGQSYSGWIDRALKFPLRIKTGDDVLMLEEIRDEPQPASSFEFPADYRKFSPEALIQQMKQSDVWVFKPGEPHH
jgi:hypothetical protein